MADDYRIGRIEDDVSELKIDVKKILENHLPHINISIAVLMAQMLIVMGGVGYLISIVVSMLKSLP